MCRSLYLAVALVAVLGGGCASLVPWALPKGEEAKNEDKQDVGKEAAERRARLVKEYEAKRDAALYQAAVEQRRHGDAEGCRRALESLVARNGRHLESRLLLAELLLDEGQHDEAKGQLEAALDDHPDDARVQHAMGLFLDTKGRPDAGSPNLPAAYEREPDNGLEALSHRQATGGDATQPSPGRERRGDRDELADCTAHPAARRVMAEVRRQISEGDPAALDAVGQAMAADPQNPRIPLAAASCALQAAQPDMAAALLDAAADRFPGEATLHRLRGLALYRVGDYHGSQLALETALSLDNSDALAYFLMGYSLMRLGQPDAAGRHFQAARRLDPTLPR